LPKPSVIRLLSKKQLNIETAEIVKVIIIVNELGYVMHARALSDNRFLRLACEKAALKARFYGTPFKIRIRTFLQYGIDPNGTVDTNF
jgi:hypothetical protein